ncbi:hypothetical protein ACRJ4B_27900 [Streptomyces sp. GTA36]
MGGRDGAVESAHRGADDHVRDEPALLQSAPDSDMRRSEHTTGTHHDGHGTGKGVQARRCGALGQSALSARRQGMRSLVDLRGSTLLTATATAATKTTCRVTPAEARGSP